MNRPDPARVLLDRLAGAGPGKRAQMLAADPGALDLLERLARQSPDLPRLSEVLAAAYRHDARYEDVIRLAEADPAPSEQVIHEKAVAQARLGHAAASLESWDRLIGQAPGLAAAWYGSHGPALEVLGWPEAERRLQRAAACPKANGKYAATLAAYDALAGRPIRAYDRRHSHVVDSAAALAAHLDPRGITLWGVAPSLLRHALGRARGDGLVLEFGVRRGTSLAVIAAAAGQPVHGFDSFEGLPEEWHGHPAGVLSTKRQMPSLGDGVHLHAGWFEDTLPAFLDARPGPVRFANLDCDIYSSTRTVLDLLAPRIGPGTVLVFDEFIGNRGWRDDEYRAFQEYVTATGTRYGIVAVNLACKQVALVIL